MDLIFEYLHEYLRMSQWQICHKYVRSISEHESPRFSEDYVVAFATAHARNVSKHMYMSDHVGSCLIICWSWHQNKAHILNQLLSGLVPQR